MQLPELVIGKLIPKYPIIQGGMAVRVSTSPLAGAVARAGGIGVIGATGMFVEELKEEIRKAREMACGGIIGINLMFAAREFLELTQAAIKEKIDIIFVGAGFSREVFRRTKESGISVVPIVSSVRAARLAEKAGAAAVVAEGFEAGGHLGTDRSVKEIVPEIVEAVKIPVIAAGGIVSGQDMADMINLGAKGIQMASRFVLSQECTVADEFKQAYLQAKEEDLVIIKSPVGLPGRAIRNKFITLLERGEAPEPEDCDACLKDCSAEYCILKALINSRDGMMDEGVIFAGKNVFKMKDILPVDTIFKRIIAEYSAI